MRDGSPLLAVRGLVKSFGALRATDGGELEVREGETLAIIRPNGAVGATRRHLPAASPAPRAARRRGVVGVRPPGPPVLRGAEPMAGMGAEESQRMIELLATLKRRQTMILVEHDMDAVFRLADRIAVLVYGRVIASDSPEKIKMNKEVRKAYLGEDT